MEFRTDRLLLRPFRHEDVSAIAEMDQDPEVMRFIASGCVDDTPAQRERLAKLVDTPPFTAPLGMWAIVPHAAPHFAGWVCLKPLEKGPDIEVGYRLPVHAWGHGYATESAACILKHGFEGAGLDRIVAVTHPENGASMRVLEKIGLRACGMRHAYGIETRAFAVTRREYEESLSHV